MTTTKLAWTPNQLDLQLIDLAFTEDLGLSFRDITTDILFSHLKHTRSRAKIISKHPTPIIISGLAIVKNILAKLDDSCEIDSEYQDGMTLYPGDVLLTLSGPAHVLLKTERTLLNFLQRLSAIATITNQFVNLIKETPAKILDTRKTIPGFRHLEKYAVTCGGGANHRMGLYDAVMIKDTHIDTLGGIAIALEKLPQDILQTCPVIVEVRNLKELKIVLDKGKNKVSRILLDNMSQDLLVESVSLCQTHYPTEASGNINMNNVLEVAKTGVDFISIGKITHSA